MILKWLDTTQTIDHAIYAFRNFGKNNQEETFKLSILRPEEYGKLLC